MIIAINEELVPFLDDYQIALMTDGRFYVLDSEDRHVGGPFSSELDAWRWLDSRAAAGKVI